MAAYHPGRASRGIRFFRSYLQPAGGRARLPACRRDADYAPAGCRNGGAAVGIASGRACRGPPQVCPCAALVPALGDPARRCARVCSLVRRLRHARGAVAAWPLPGRAGWLRAADFLRISIMMKTLFLQAPSFDGFDGGAGARYQAKREIRSFWYPTWLAQPAALVPGSRLVDAPPARLRLDEVLPVARDYELAVLHTSTPSFASDVKVAAALKDVNPRLKIGFVGAKVAVEPEPSLSASTAVDFVAREEFDFTIKEVAEGRRWDDIDGLSYRDGAG